MSGEKLTKVKHAHTNLTMFHAIIALAESGCFYGYVPELSGIIQAAKRGAQRCLREMDRHTAALKALGGSDEQAE